MIDWNKAISLPTTADRLRTVWGHADVENLVVAVNNYIPSIDSRLLPVSESMYVLIRSSDNINFDFGTIKISDPRQYHIIDGFDKITISLNINWYMLIEDCEILYDAVCHLLGIHGLCQTDKKYIFSICKTCKKLMKKPKCEE